MTEIYFTLKIVEINSRLASRLRRILSIPNQNSTELRAILSTMQNLDQLYTPQFQLAEREKLGILAEFIEPLDIEELLELKELIQQYTALVP